MGDFDALLAVQQTDTAADQLRHRLANLPERDALAALVSDREALVGQADATKLERLEISRKQKQLEDEAATIEAKVRHDDEQLYGGGITSPKEAEALQHELEALKVRLNDHEDLVLEQMEAAEPVDARLAELADQLSAVESKITIATAELEAAAAGVNDELNALETTRAEQAEPLSAELLASYDALRSQLGGIAVAKLNGDKCEGCHLQLSAVEFDEVKRAPADDTVYCPSCSRILVR